MQIDMIAAAIPPKFDAIGKYTTLLAEHMATTDDIRILTEDASEYDPIANVAIQGAFTIANPQSFNRLTTLIAERKPDWVILQYNPFGYGRWGWNPVLPFVLQNLRRQSPQTRIAVMFHETFVPNINWKFRIMRRWQRVQAKQLCRAAATVFVSVESWGEEVKDWVGEKPLVHLPIPSNIPDSTDDPASIRAELGIAPDTFVVGVFGVNHISRSFDLMRETVIALHKQEKNLLLMDMGPTENGVVHPPPEIKTRIEGRLSEREVSRRFAIMDLFLTPFVDGVSTRRTSMMVALQHGVASIGTLGIHTDSLFRAEAGKIMLLSPVDKPAEFQENALRAMRDSELRGRIGRAATEYYNLHFTRERIWEKMRSTLEAEKYP